MIARYIYMKFLGFLLVILGFSYSLTSFYNFYNYIFGNIAIANGNVWVMILGLIIPLYMLIFGLFFYFYADKNITKINKSILFSAFSLSLIGIICLLLKNSIIYDKLFFIAQLVEFLHISIGYVLLVLGVMLIYGCIKYKY